MIVSLKRTLWLSQAALFGPFVVCTIILPSVTKKNGGVSNFGDHLSTLFLYIFAFAIAALSLNCAAAKLFGAGVRSKARLLVILAILYIIVLVTTFSRRFGPAYYELHDYVAVLLYAYEVVLSVQMLAVRPKWGTMLFFGVQITGSLIGLLSSLHTVYLLYYGQMIGGIGFGLMLGAVFPSTIEPNSHLDDALDRCRESPREVVE